VNKDQAAGCSGWRHLAKVLRAAKHFISGELAMLCIRNKTNASLPASSETSKYLGLLPLICPSFAASYEIPAASTN